MSDQRFYFNHNKQTNILTIEVTVKVAFEIIKIFREKLPIEMMKSNMEIVDVVNDEGVEYKNVRRYTTVVMPDKVEAFFAAAQALLTKSISQSIVHTNN